MAGHPDIVSYVVADDLAGERADLVVARAAGLSRAAARTLVESGEATFDGAELRPRDRISAGTVVQVRPPSVEVDALQPEPVAFAVMYDEAGVAVVDKPPGVVVHPGAGRRRGTLAAGLLYRWPELEGVGDPDRWGLVHRLDRDTSGLLVVARTEETHRALRIAMQRREIGRSYQALVEGVPGAAAGTIDAPIGRDPRHPTRMRVDPEGRRAVTHYRRLEVWRGGWSSLRVDLETGRTHQIRVHLASIGLPVVGDAVYGTRRGVPPDPGRVWLHAAELRFTHPVTGELVTVRSPLPSDLAESLAALGAPAGGRGGE